MVGFIPDKPTAPTFEVKFFEDITAKDVPGREVEKPLDFYEKRIVKALGDLGAFRVVFTPGMFPGEPKRYGFQITFSLNGIPGRIDCAALPLRAETPKKKDRAQAQALYLVATWLEMEVSSLAWRPGAIPLVPYLMDRNGQTVTEALVERQELLNVSPYALPAGES